MNPEMRYARTVDDVSIAFWTYGEGPVLVETPLVPFSHIELEWQNPHIRRWYERLGRMVTVVRYDGRGTGLSQRAVDDVSIEAQVRDLEAVIGSVSSDPVSLMGVFHSGPAAVVYTAENPGRVSHLLLWCSYASGADYWKAAKSEGLRALRQTDYMLFLRTAAHELIGWADDDESDLYAEIMRKAVDPEQADKLIAATRDIDVTAQLSDVGCPTLVLHRRGLDWLDITLSRDLASRIPQARLVVLDGQSPLPAAGDIEPVIGSIGEFLNLEVPKARPTAKAMEFRAVLFTDLVDHTTMMSALGDDRGRQVLREHDRITREVLSEYGGTEMKALGDGFMASFTSVTSAVESAIALQRRIDAWNKKNEDSYMSSLSVRVGLNAGEPIQEEGDLFGATVILASRIASSADGGEIAVANTVRELTTGKGFSFSDRGAFDPKGFDEPIQIWTVDWSE
jgi:class 3 adenylate cyclase/pimeloyl-ACP methyl ester carboxylesterase